MHNITHCPHCGGEGMWYDGYGDNYEVDGCYHCRGTGYRQPWRWLFNFRWMVKQRIRDFKWWVWKRTHAPDDIPF